MPHVRQNVVAILCSDFHLSLNPPIWRSAEPNWFAAMNRPLNEIKLLQEECDCPVINAGDIFDRWDSTPELINFAIDSLPNELFAIPGQHDLPLHNYDDMKKSAYWTLVQANKIGDISNACRYNYRGHRKCRANFHALAMYGFPFGYPITPLDEEEKNNKADKIHIAVVHEYRCVKGKSFKQAPDKAYLRMNEKNLIGYDVIVYGDNHKGFLTKINNGTTVFNCGTLMRRKTDEIDYKPQIGLLYSDGSVEPYYLNTTNDKHLESISDVEAFIENDMKSFIKELKKLGNSELNFKEAVHQYLKSNKVKKSIATLLLKGMER